MNLPSRRQAISPPLRPHQTPTYPTTRLLSPLSDPFPLHNPTLHTPLTRPPLPNQPRPPQTFTLRQTPLARARAKTRRNPNRMHSSVIGARATREGRGRTRSWTSCWNISSRSSFAIWAVISRSCRRHSTSLPQTQSESTIDPRLLRRRFLPSLPLTLTSFCRILEQHQSKTLPSLLSNAICAIASRFSSHPLLLPLRSDPSRIWESAIVFEETAKKLLVPLLSFPSVETASALVLVSTQTNPTERDGRRFCGDCRKEWR
jgi:hypothetical protein